MKTIRIPALSLCNGFAGSVLWPTRKRARLFRLYYNPVIRLKFETVIFGNEKTLARLPKEFVLFLRRRGVTFEIEKSQS